MITVIYDKFRFRHDTAASFDAFKSRALLNQELSWRDHLDRSPFPSKTDRVLLLGPLSLKAWTGKEDLNKHRGFPQVVTFGPQAFPAIATYHPQDAADWKMSEDFRGADNEKDVGRTAPGNWRGWSVLDALKLVRGPVAHEPLNYEAYPAALRLKNICYSLLDAKGQTIFLDIECRRGDQNLNCIGLAIDDSKVCVIPIYLASDTIAYPTNLLLQFFHTLSIALCRNRVVIHNAGFDLSVLAWRYGMPFGYDIFDTMLCQHRIEPELEKSLSHTISYHTWLPQHKDMESGYWNHSQQAKYWEYNARDVYAMREVYKAQLALIAKDSGLQASVDQVMESLPDYITMGIRGVSVFDHRLYKLRVQHQKRLVQIKRIVDFLAGRNLNPNSSDQCVNYFHNTLRYKIVSRSRETGKPSLDQPALYKLRLTHNNPLIDTIIKYRELSKEAGMINFKPHEHKYLPPTAADVSVGV